MATHRRATRRVASLRIVPSFTAALRSAWQRHVQRRFAERRSATHRTDMPDQTQTFRLADLELDSAIWPRQARDAANVAQLVTAIRDGETLPPLVVDQGGRILDGWHRYEAYKAVHGSDHEVACEVVDCATNYDALVRAARLNWRHGQRLSEQDKSHVTALVERLGVTAAQFAADLGTSVSAVKRLSETRVMQRADVSERQGPRVVRRPLVVGDDTSRGNHGTPSDVVVVRNCTHLLKNRALHETDETRKLVLALYVEAKNWLQAAQRGAEAEAA